MSSESTDIAFTLLKYVLVLATMPIWLPFAKALWEEFRDAMRVEGGFSGPGPGPNERREIEDQLDREEPRQVHELLAHHRERQARGETGAASPAKTGPAPRRRQGAAPAARSARERGFR